MSSGGACLTAAGDGSVALGDCAGAQTWQLDANGELRANDVCLAAQPDGSVRAGGCVGGADHTFFVDDEHHVWSRLPPPATSSVDGAQLDCLDDHARLSPCGASRAPTWDFLAPIRVTARSALAGVAGTGRAVRLGDLTGDGKADLCAVAVASTTGEAPTT